MITIYFRMNPLVVRRQDVVLPSRLLKHETVGVGPQVLHPLELLQMGHHIKMSIDIRHFGL
jgi:hypothetical protein